MRPIKVILTCEHATNKVPTEYAYLFEPNRVVTGLWGTKKIKEIINDHWGCDRGAVIVAKYLATKLKTSLFIFPVSRLLIEPDNTGYYHEQLFHNTVSYALTKLEKEKIIDKYWLPHIENINKEIQNKIKSNEHVLHMPIHSFTPVKNGIKREVDISIIYDPKNKTEITLARNLQNSLKSELPDLTIRRNHLYTGGEKGLQSIPKHFKRHFPKQNYLSLELEICNKHLLPMTKSGREIMNALAKSIPTSILKED